MFCVKIEGARSLISFAVSYASRTKISGKRLDTLRKVGEAFTRWTYSTALPHHGAMATP